ncbi:hypothetical protein [Sulfuricurvum sp.]|uniref:hypothetical protein n=1 Tax=Sulfuricurvum sp. TaxID=2025608 RepID=UPI003C65CE01
MSDYETICDITGKMGEESIDAMIDIINGEEKSNVFESSYGSAQIAQGIENISTAIELNNLLKNMNILLENRTLNPLLKNNNLVIYYNGVDKKGNKYTQLRWTKVGREFILKALKAYTTIVEPLLITNTKIQEYKHPTYTGCYDLEVMDQYGRWWSYKGDSSSNEKSTFEDMQKIATQEINKAIIDIDLFYVHYDDNIKNIKRHEEVLYVYTYDMHSEEYGRNYVEKIDKYAGYILIVTKDFLEYRHLKIFDNYQNAKQLALKIKNEGVVNLEFWTCLGNYCFESNYHEEFEEKCVYDDHEYDMADVYKDFATENGEPTYLSDGVWLYPNGSMRDDK